jgi:hypothetical protein
MEIEEINMGKRRRREFREYVDKYCKDKNVDYPVDFLLKLMEGKDPRLGRSKLFDCIKKIHDDDDIRLPTMAEWHQIKDIVLFEPGYYRENVPLKTSLDAVKEIMDRLEPKLKATELSGNTELNVATRPLSDKEVARLLNKVDENF